MNTTPDTIDEEKLPENFKCGLDEALEDIKAGRLVRFESVEALFKELGI